MKQTIARVYHSVHFLDLLRQERATVGVSYENAVEDEKERLYAADRFVRGGGG
ncbi:uncharacterized protein PHALS_12104 [Plasmopara halstedii]|uniref:Uncharacterized protein n=1 Tax=Plasmopara halstedii TaxID=4781 RepID=A0A0P1AK69_PLAHL|nr:uncharacterized protein PHALS_12104 [Plasmopara halstedii]CEG41775.1 hypothetical protein PHALS_12104 [Plasmopara halstedii]|eukprot:XP_024578144.1 hypothetical protein PHALS_12104 [Plasmopara halstedii]